MPALAIVFLALIGVAAAAKDSDLVTEPLPGFPQQPFRVYSGFLNVSDAQRVSGYDRMVIHYQFDVMNTDLGHYPLRLDGRPLGVDSKSAWMA